MSGRRSEPTPIGPPADPEMPQACLDAAAHVANCPRCRAGLRAHLDATVAELVEELLNDHHARH